MKGIPEITISPRFCGPPGTSNGGYTCGLLDNLTDYISEVTLRRPPPLDKALQVRREGDPLQLMDGDHLIASARPGAVEFTAPPPPEWKQAVGITILHRIQKPPLSRLLRLWYGTKGARRTSHLRRQSGREAAPRFPWIPDPELVARTARSGMSSSGLLWIAPVLSSSAEITCPNWSWAE
ncbi:MAG: hypothetical protein H6558_10685 [Lewinellaceae bacterium]|nr:hypothetical protein [Lewinellaceae bacterium]